MSFGTLAVDANRPVQRWPAVSLLTGLLANALGWQRTDGAALDRLQARLHWAARIDRPGVPLRDFQTAQLTHDDAGWTTRGTPEGRAGGRNTYDPPHIRLRDYRADASVAVALRLGDVEEAPTLRDLANALRKPRRPLFIGRKTCAPALPLLAGLHEAPNAVAALSHLPLADDSNNESAVFFSAKAAPRSANCIEHLTTDCRNFVLDVHTGQQVVYELLPVSATEPAA